MDKAAALANSMPTVMPAFAVAGGGEMAVGQAGMAVASGLPGPAGPFGTALASTIKSEDSDSKDSPGKKQAEEPIAKEAEETSAGSKEAVREPRNEAGASRLVGANRAIMDPRKLTEYALNPRHPTGGNKARVFERLGFNLNNAEELMKQVRAGVAENTPIAGKVDEFGARFTVDIPVTGPQGSGIVRTGWIYKPGSNTPELTTLFVK